MKNNGHKPANPMARLPRCPTGIQGLDEITGGGLPCRRPTLVRGGAGCGKTLFTAEFLVRGAAQFGEPGVLMSFEETDAELKANVASLGFDLGLAIPTAVRKLPKPARTTIGRLTDVDRVLVGLDLCAAD